MSKSSIQSIERALNVLEYFNAEKREVGVTDLSKEMDINKSTLYGIMQTLVKRNYLRQNQENSKYMLGLKILELGSLVKESLPINKVAKKYLKELVNKQKETVHLGMLEDMEVVFIDKIESSQSIRMVSKVGKRVPAHCTALGKVILAHFSECKLKKLLYNRELKKVTANTITDPDKLLKNLKKIRKKGYAIDDREVIEGVKCVSAPVKDYSGSVIASLSVSGPAFRMNSNKIKKIIEDVTDKADKISYELGYRNDF